MGAGRKTQSYTVDTLGSHNAAFEVKQRNLGESLGGVIFMCNNDTIRECQQHLVFGLPSPHWCYVQYIQRGMPIFLYNFSDKLLHGIYRAVDEGGWEIRPHGWTGDDISRTRYPAQVQVEVHLKCPPLAEKQFHSVIAANYHRERGQDKFKQELDKQQAAELCALFHKERARLGFGRSDAPQGEQQRQQATAHGQSGGSSYSSRVSGSARANGAQASSNGHVSAASSQTTASTAAAATWSARQAEVNQPSRHNNVTQARSSHAYQDHQQQRSQEESKTTMQAAYRPPTSFSATQAPSSAGFPARTTTTTTITSKPGVDVLSDSITALKSTLGPVVARLRASPLATDPATADELSANLRDLDAALMECQKERAKLLNKVEKLEGQLGQSQIPKQQQQHASIVSSTPTDGASAPLTASPVRAAPPAVANASAGESGEVRATWHWPSGASTLALLVGGLDGEKCVSSCELYSAAENTWYVGPEMPMPRVFCGAATLGRCAYVVGGGQGTDAWLDSAIRLDIESGEWTSIASMAKPCGSMACTALDGKIYSVGGGFQRTYYDTADAYDPGSDTWIPLACMNSLRFSTAGTALNGALYCCGGYDGTAYLDTVERFDPREGRWQQVASMCTGRGALSVVASHGCVWVLGGYNAIEHGFLTSVEKYDPRMDKWGWATMESLPQPRAYGTAFALGNAIYVNGGMQEPGKNLGLARFNVEENVWEEMTAALCPNRSMMAAVVVSNL